MRTAETYASYADELLCEIEQNLGLSRHDEGVHCFVELATMKDRISCLRRDVCDILLSLDSRSWNTLQTDVELCEKLQGLFRWRMEEFYEHRTCEDHQVFVW